MKINLRLIATTLLVFASVSAFGQHYKILYNFRGLKGGDGAYPISTLTRDTAGNLYGTTVAGGAHDCGPYGGCGTVFELSPNSDGTWTESVLYSFCGNRVNNQCYDGEMPEGGLIMDASGNLYGTTSEGGAASCPVNKAGCGTVFELSPPSPPGGLWTESVLYNFCENEQSGVCLEGSAPGQGMLAVDGTGNLYGTTQTGGTGATSLIAGGVVFELSPGLSGWTETVLHNFCVGGSNQICPDGNGPSSGVTFDALGNLYGTTIFGGFPRIQGEGTVYKLTPVSGAWNETVLYALRGAFHTPAGNVSFDSAGNLYASINQGGPLGNFGGILKLSPANGGTAHIFAFNGANGSMPTSGVLADGVSNAIYGIAQGGGSQNAGVLFSIGPKGKRTSVHTFCQRLNCTDGAYPVAGLIADPSGNLYGTTQRGGKTTDGASYGVVYEVTP